MRIITVPDTELDAFIKKTRSEFPQLDNKTLYHGALLSDKIPYSDLGVWEYLDFLKYLSIYYDCR